MTWQYVPFRGSSARDRFDAPAPPVSNDDLRLTRPSKRRQLHTLTMREATVFLVVLAVGGLLFLPVVPTYSRTKVHSSKVYIAPRRMVSSEVSEEQRARARQLEAARVRQRKIAEQLEHLAKGAKTYTDAEGNVHYNGKVPIVLSAEDNGSGVRALFYRVNDGDELRYSNPLLFTADGRYMIAYTAEDLAGNRSPPKRFHFTVDSKPPDVRMDPLERFRTMPDGTLVFQKRATLHFAATDSTVGVKAVFVKTGSGGFDILNDEKLEIGEPGKHLVVAAAVDHLDNRSKDAAWTLILDPDPPAIFGRPTHPTILRGKERFCQAGTALIVEGRDDLSGMDKLLFRREGTQTWRTYRGPVPLVPGPQTWEMKAIDHAGNESEVLRFGCTLDRASPKTEVRPK